MSITNDIENMRIKALNLTAEVLDESSKLKDTKPEIRESAIAQLLSLAKAILATLAQSIEDDKEAETLSLIYELLNQLREDE